MNKYESTDILCSLKEMRKTIDRSIALIECCDFEPPLLYKNLLRFAKQSSFPQSFFDDELHGLHLNTFASLVICDYKNKVLDAQNKNEIGGKNDCIN